MGKSSSVVDLSPPKLKAHMSELAVMSTALHKASLSQNELGQFGELPRVVADTADGGFHAEKSPAPVFQVRNHSPATATGANVSEITAGHIETMGSLVMPSVLVQCSVSDGLSAEKPFADFTHSMRPMSNPDGVYVKPAPQPEPVGCPVVSLLEKVGIELGLKQSEAHLVYKLRPMTTSPGFSKAGNCSNTYLGPFFSTFSLNGFEEKPMVFPSCFVMSVEMSRSDFEGSFLVSQSLEALQVGAFQKTFLRFTSDWKSLLGLNMASRGGGVGF